MADWSTSSQLPAVTRSTAIRLVSATLLSMSLWAGAAVAKDPFRTSNARPIGDRTEAAFNELFQKGNYKKAADALKQAESGEPLAYAMKASMTYFDWQAQKDSAQKAQLLEQFRAYGTQTRDSAQSLLASDRVRGNLYLAVSYFLDGAYSVIKDGTIKGAPAGLSSLQQAFKYMDEAEKQAPNDPEVNLIKGFMDLMVAANLPFSDPSKAIARLEQYAGPKYLADRGIALGYRELNQRDKALVAIERSLQATPDNPEVMYLKGQILYGMGRYQDSKQWYEKALAKQKQLPDALGKQIKRELKNANKKLGIST